MASIPLPALDIKTPQQPGPLEDVSKLMALRSMMNQGQMQQQEMQIRAQQVKDQQATTTAMKTWDGKDYDALAKSVLDNGGSATAAQGIQKHGLDVKKTVSDIAAQDATSGSKNLETFIGKQKALGDGLSEAKDIPDDQLQGWALGKIKTFADGGVLDGQAAAHLAQGVQQAADPKALRDQIQVIANSALGAKAVAEQQKTVAETKKDTAQEGEATATADQKRAESAWYNAHGGAPGVPVEAQGMAAYMMDPHIDAGVRKNPATFLAWKAKQAPLATFNLQSGMLTDQAKDMAAENYFQTGQLPAGARSPAMISQIINRAGQLHPGGSLAGNKAAFEANKASYDNVTKTLDTLSAFENAGLKNLKQFTDLADKLPDTGIPWANTPVRLLNNKLVGDEWMPAVEAARTVALREIARVTNDPKLSGTLTDSARQEVEGLSPQNATMNQIKHVVDVLKNDMANVHQGLAQQKQDIGGRLGIKAGGEQQQSTPAAATKVYNGHTYEKQSDGSWKLKQ